MHTIAGLRSCRFAVPLQVSCAVILMGLTGMMGLAGGATARGQAGPTGALRADVKPVKDGAELITLFADIPATAFSERRSVPVMIVLRDTLRDQDPENDLLRYLWVPSFTRPTVSQRTLAAIPFFYARVSSRTRVTDVPPPLLDLSRTRNTGIARISWWVVQRSLLDSISMPVMALSRTSTANYYSYKGSQLSSAVMILNLYRQAAGASPFGGDGELSAIGGSLYGQNVKGAVLSSEQLEKQYEREFHRANTTVGINWDILRQRAEEEGLIFEPIPSLTGEPFHAVLWILKSELASKTRTEFNSRFLNIANPWTDVRLRSWKQYTKGVWVDSDRRLVAEETAGARKDELIPLALYALDFPKIPALLVDFRDTSNPKKREMSRLVLNDLARYAADISFSVTNPSYFVARRTYDYLTSKKGIDFNQQSREPAYARLKTVLMLDCLLDPKFKTLIAKDLEKLTTDPLQNDLGAEMKIAAAQYDWLIRDLESPESKTLSRLNRDRNHERRALAHGRASRFFFQFARLMSFGRYDHREKFSTELEHRYELARRMRYHERVLRLAAASTVDPEVDQDVEKLRRSVEFVVEHGATTKANVSPSLEKIFSRSRNEEFRRQCLMGLSAIRDDRAKRALARIASNQRENPALREMSRNLLAAATRPAQETRGKGPAATTQLSQ